MPSPRLKCSTHEHTRPTMSLIHFAISRFVACICRWNDSTVALNLISYFSIIPWKVYFGKDHIPIYLPKLQPVSNTVWRKKVGFNQVVSTVYGLLKSNSITNIIPLVACKVPIETFATQHEATKLMHKVQHCVFGVNHLQAI